MKDEYSNSDYKIRKDGRQAFEIIIVKSKKLNIKIIIIISVVILSLLIAFLLIYFLVIKKKKILKKK